MKKTIIKMVLYIAGHVLFLLIACQIVEAQTNIKAGNVQGIWTIQGSPYLIIGDINIPEGKTLIIQPGVKVKFKGSYNINVQGSISAIGTVNDSIIFTISDTNGFSNNNKVGWNGIHFDPRPIAWDTIRFRTPEDEEIKQAINERVKKGLIDTTTKIILALQGPDLVNDKSFDNAKNINKQGSRLDYCRFEYGTAGGRLRPYIFGGAIYIYRYSNIVISNSVFENNQAYAGGAIYCKEAAPVIINNVIRNCQAVSSGGAMVFIHSGPIILGNKITDNTSGYNGGGILYYESCPYVLSNSLLRNTAANSGGALYIERKTSQIITTKDYKANENTKVSNNLSSMNVNLSKDIVKNTGSSNGRFINNLICDNKAKNGGGTGLYATAPEFTNNTICNNRADSTGGGFYSFYASPVIINSIIYGNQSADEGGKQMNFLGESRLEISYSDIELGLSGISKDSTCKLSLDYFSNLNSLPLFNNSNKYDYSLQIGSPCIDAGKPDTTYLKQVSLDLKGKNRINNKVIDMGAIEYIETGKNTLKYTNDNYMITTENDFSGEMVFNMYPNPSNGRFSIVIYNNQYPTIQISVFSQNGQKVYDKVFATENFVEEKANLEGKPAGIYVIHVSSGNKIIYRDVIIIE